MVLVEKSRYSFIFKTLIFFKYSSRRRYSSEFVDLQKVEKPMQGNEKFSYSSIFKWLETQCRRRRRSFSLQGKERIDVGKHMEDLRIVQSSSRWKGERGFFGILRSSVILNPACRKIFMEYVREL